MDGCKVNHNGRCNNRPKGAMTMEKMIERQIESLKEKIKEAKAEGTSYALCYLEGNLQAWNDIQDLIEDLKHNQ